MWDHQNGTFQIAPFFKTADKNYVTDLAEAKELIKTGLKTAINRQLISDAPIGVFLSGGIDSSVIDVYKRQGTMFHLQ